MQKFNLEKAVEYYQEEKNITEACKKHCEELGIEYSEKYRNRLSRALRKEDVDNVTETKTTTVGYKTEVSNMPSAWSSEKNRFYSIEEYCEVYGLDISTVKSAKLISHNSSHMIYNIVFFTDDEESVQEVDNHLEEIVQKYIKPYPIKYLGDGKEDKKFFDRLVFTDVHIGMDVNGKDGDPLYDGVWNREEILRRLSVMVNHVKRFKKSNTLIIDELGDFLDGLGGQTTRKGHDLPQNMNDKEVFDLALEFKIGLIDSLVNEYQYIICNNITNDNHSGVFGYFASSATKQILEQRYGAKVQVNSIKRFMHHYTVGNHTFVISHGKDIGENKFGFKPKLDAIQAEKIDQYCKEHKLYNGNFIEFSKGDSHQAIYDDTTSNDFSYYNYPSFSPPSNWVKTNYKNSKSGFNFFNISRDENIKISIPYWF